MPIANAALSVKDSGATLDAKARNALVIGKLDYMAGQFHDWLRGTYLGLTPGATVPAWITKEKLTHSTLKETLFTDGAAWDKWLSLCKVLQSPRVQQVTHQSAASDEYTCCMTLLLHCAFPATLLC